MKKFLILLFLCLAIVAGFLFRKPVSSSSQPRLQVVVSGYVPYALAKQLGGGLVSVEMLLPPNAEPHAFEPAPGSLVAVHKAAVFVYVSTRLEPWVRDVLGAAGKDTRVVELSAGLPATGDPHLWMDFGLVLEMARTLTEAFAQADPAHADTYRENLVRFEREIAVLDRDFAGALAACQNRKVVHVGHLAFGALAKRYNLMLTALAGSSHEGEHSVRKLADLVKYIRAQQVTALFTEEAVSPRLAQTVSAETGARILPLYTVEHVTKEDFDASVTYGQLMRRNLKNLQEGLQCQP